MTESNMTEPQAPNNLTPEPPKREGAEVHSEPEKIPDAVDPKMSRRQFLKTAVGVAAGAVVGPGEPEETGKKVADPPSSAPDVVAPEITAPPEAREAQSLVEKFNSMSEPEKADARRMASTKQPKTMAMDMAEEGWPEGDAQDLLRALYDKTPQAEEIDTLFDEQNPQNVLAAFNTPQAQAAREEEGIDLGETEQGRQADKFVKENREEIDSLNQEARTMLANPNAVSDEYRQSWLRRVTGTFGDASGKTLLKLLKYSSIGIGIFAILFIFLTALHSKGGKQ